MKHDGFIAELLDACLSLRVEVQQLPQINLREGGFLVGGFRSKNSGSYLVALLTSSTRIWPFFIFRCIKSPPGSSRAVPTPHDRGSLSQDPRTAWCCDCSRLGGGSVATPGHLNRNGAVIFFPIAKTCSNAWQCHRNFYIKSTGNLWVCRVCFDVQFCIQLHDVRTKTSAPQLFWRKRLWEIAALAQTADSPRQLWVPSSGLWAQQPCRRCIDFGWGLMQLWLKIHQKSHWGVNFEKKWGSFFDDIYSWSRFFPFV